MENLDIEKLINEIHLRPSVWNMRSEDYSKKIKKKRAWEEVTDAFVDENATQEEKREIGRTLQKKWKNIRDRYARELKQNKGKSGQARKGKNVYMYANQLTFLSDVMHRLPTDASMDDMDPPSPNQETGSVTETLAVLDEPSDVHVAKKRKVNLVERKLLEAIENHTVRQKQKAETEKVNFYEDDDKLFLLSLLPFFKTIPPHFKFAARMDVMQSLNKFMIVQPPSVSHLHPHQVYSQNYNQAPGHQSGTQLGQYFDLQPRSTGMQPYLSQSSSLQQEPQPGPSGIESGSTGMQSYYRQDPLVHQQGPQQAPSGIQHQSAASLISPADSLQSQDDSEISLF